MGRHRRSAAGPAAEEPAAGSAARSRGARRKKSAVPLRTGLLGVSAAVAVGAVAVASGLVPGGDTSPSGTTAASDQVRSGGAAPDLLTQGGSSTEPAGRSSSPTGRGSERPEAPASPSTSDSPSTSPSKTPSRAASPTEAASEKPAVPQPRKSGGAKAPTAPRTSTPPASKTPAPPKVSAAPTPSRKPSATPTDASARSEVLALVNQERAKAGCSPLSTSAPLTSLAQNFSEDMAARGFFDHTNPDGDTPWDRAARAGVQGLGAENIARGQADARAVMDAWMDSDGHRANILNCDYKTIGIGIHQGSGGPWWVQNFGF
ncbi:CAP domain-containing protein [Streptomyces sp. V2I9]|uniref:CAP domain-containing protein n=1 Tax=Streptomyces sp. V2I9 TaxID=3042304 RepID=UPI0027884DEA|nr:CAP domain-containing protein [Streptomyces sp. V2I9]MDQ0987329.1 uncharacterized protein YkwD [Streptomyces sp. V2I9]